MTRTSKKRDISHTKPDIYTQVTNQIIEQLEKGTIPWRQTWNSPHQGFAQNYLTGHEYRGINWFLLNLFSPYKLPYYLTWSQIHDHYRGTVKKGTKAQRVFYFNTYYKNEKGKRIPIEEALKLKDAGKKVDVVSFLKQYYVFNLSCTEGIDWKQPLINPKNNNPIPKCEELLDNMEEIPTILHQEEFEAFYNPIKDQINMPKLELFENSNAFYLVLFHELIHWTGHLHRLCRLGIITPHPGRQIYAEEELIAEFGASMLATIVGIEQIGQVENSAAYIQSWLKCLKADKKLIFRLAPQIHRAVDYIIGKPQNNYESSIFI